MSYMIFEVKCTKCNWRGNTSFGIVGMTQIAEPIKECPSCHAVVEGVKHVERPIARIDRIIRKIHNIWKLNPDYRLGQLISNILKEDENLYYLEDQDLEIQLEKTYKLEHELNGN